MRGNRSRGEKESRPPAPFPFPLSPFPAPTHFVTLMLTPTTAVILCYEPAATPPLTA
jgi:hypothetical protein